ncbi:diflavin oxidoreductase [Chitinimonas prasina]|uniref:diflavin oxidoreductase n=1 Tax=Chitinimonas prasina TaxID=1434937 RepID=UPI0024E0F985|nr:sulfite reductase flavoprotein subunit alpha [Chitinimonas prasina]
MKAGVAALRRGGADIAKLQAGLRHCLATLAAAVLLLALLSSAARWWQPCLQRLLDPAATQVDAAGQPLSAVQLRAHAHEAFGPGQVVAVQPPSTAGHAAVAVLVGELGPELRYLNPYNGKALPRPRGRHAFAALVRQHQAWGGYGGSLLAAVLAALSCYALQRAPRRDVTTSQAVLVAHASQTGHAEELAEKTAAALQAAGLHVVIKPLGTLTVADLADYQRALLVVSTFGEGEAPDSAQDFSRQLGRSAKLAGLHYGLLALGDSHYPHFCGFGRQLDAWLAGQGATTLFEHIEVDQGDPSAVAAWQTRLTELTGQMAPAWQGPRFDEWRLVDRRRLNPGSLGAGAFHIALAPPADEFPVWQSGDIVEILPQHPPARVQAWLAQQGWDGEQAVAYQDSTCSLQTALANSVWPEAPAADIPSLLAQLKPLRPREYSIASVPDDGRLELLVRQIKLGDELSLGSGWLTEHAPLEGTVRLHIRSNPGFHLPAQPVPMILIGNGTGLASLRAHLKAAPGGGHWLIFGERQAAHDYFYRDELAAWQSDGTLARLDTAFSRDQAARIYVQDLLREAGDEVIAWVERGAALYICGSAAGMAPTVHAVLTELLGEAALASLAQAGRYRRDVY